jgi:CitB family two-component system response regulator CitT
LINIAIAEDDFRVAYIHEQFIEEIEGVQLKGKALNAKQMMSMLATNEIDLLLLDNYMPDALGVSLLPSIRKEFPSVDIIMITAAADSGTVEPSLNYGVVDYLIKPVSFERFKLAVENYMNKKSFFNQNQELNQKMLDQYFYKDDYSKVEKILPKGIDPLTLQKVEELLAAYQEGCTAEALGENLGASRTTARRYLEYLISINKAKAELEYGLVGRPERIYYCR